MSPKRAGDLEIDQDLEYQRREWTAQRAGWATMAVIALLALPGLFGQGILSQARAGSGSLQVEYERFS